MTRLEDDDTLAAAATATEDAHTWSADALVAGRYRVLGWLGGGGMGQVYRAEDTELGEVVALKVLRRSLVGDAVALERFRREAKLARRVSHRNVARVFDIGEHGGEKFLTMELVDGEPLSARLVRGGPLPAERAVALVRELCAGLAAAHAAGVVHRDLKPDNVMLARDGRLVITDFGIARAAVAAQGATIEGQIVGTPAYMAPEQLEARVDVDARADLWAVGVILFELVTGHRPWTGSGPVAIALAQVRDPDPDPRLHRPELPAPLVDIIRRCLARDPAQRFAGADELAAALGPSATTEARLATPTSGQYAAAPVRAAVAVLPFGCAGDDAYLAEGLCEALIDCLSMTPGLRVRPFGQVRGATAGDARTVGLALGVDHVVEGSIRRGRDDLRITTRLVSVADGFQIWAQRHDCDAGAVLDVGDRIARGIAEALSTRAATARRPSDPRAVELYLRGRHEMHRVWGDAMHRAIGLLEEAVALAPDEPTFLATLAFARVRRWNTSTDAALGDAARAAVERAVAVAPGHGETRLALAMMRLHAGDARAAAVDLGAAIARAPLFAEAHTQAGRLLIEIGAVDEGVERLRTAVELDPSLRVQLSCDIGRMAALRGDWGEADRLTGVAMATDIPELQTIARLARFRLAVWRGDVATASEAVTFREAGPHIEQFARFLSGILHDGRVDEAPWQRMLARMTDNAGGVRARLFYAQLMAEMAAAVGRYDRAAEALTWAVDHGLIDIVWLDGCPLWKPYAPDPGFVAMRARVADRATQALAAYRTTAPAATPGHEFAQSLLAIDQRLAAPIPTVEK